MVSPLANLRLVRDRKTAMASVRPLAVKRDNDALVDGVRAGQTWAKAALFDRYCGDVQRILLRVIGSDPELADLIHEVFLRALEGIDRLDDAANLRPWLLSIAVYAARERIRRRRRRWWQVLACDELPEEPVEEPRYELRQALRAMYTVLDRMDVDERIAITLHRLEGMTQPEVARVCKVSLSTAKRRLARAEDSFRRMVSQDPVLCDWVKGGASWRDE